MAKGIEMNGMLRGRRGGNVYYRANGEQVSRVYNPTVANPKTSGQLYQRAVMATVMRAYSQGREIYDHSFEGKKVGSGSQREFIKLNAKKLRALLAQDVNGGATAAEAQAHLCAPGLNVAVPNTWTVAQGSLALNYFGITAGTSAADAKLKIPAAFTETETVAQYCTRLGLVPGEIYTIVGHAISDDTVLEVEEGEDNASIFKSSFGFVRLTVKQGVLEDNTIIYDNDFSSLFEVEASQGVRTNIEGCVITTSDGEYDLSNSIQINGNTPIVFGIIRSNENSKLRSNCELVAGATLTFGDWGLKYMYAIEAWKAGSTRVGNSSLILEGGSF